MRRLASFLFAILLCSCSGTDSTQPRSLAREDEAPQDPEVASAPDPAPEPARPEVESDGPPCSGDNECEMVTPCCGCPRVPGAMHVLEAASAREMCTRVRCASCAVEPPPGPPQVARCQAGACIAVSADTPSEPLCNEDADCVVHAPCCECPANPRAMHIETRDANLRSCMARTCMVCETPTDGPVPSAARCNAGVCEAAP